MAGGGSGGAGGQPDQSDISQREKEIIASTWKQQGDRGATQQQAAESGKFLSEVQSKLADQARSLSFRMQSRELSQENESFNSFVQDMNAAAEAMVPAAGKLKQLQWQDAIPAEQKALQAFAFAPKRRSAKSRLPLVKEVEEEARAPGAILQAFLTSSSIRKKNQYETAQTASPEDQRSKDIDEALRKLDELARRQEELAQQRTKQFSRFAAALAARKCCAATRRNCSARSSSLPTRITRAVSKAVRGAAANRAPGQSGQQAGSDPRIQQALDRLRQANDDMRRASSQQQNNADARSAADRLREATDLLGGAPATTGLRKARFDGSRGPLACPARARSGGSHAPCVQREGLAKCILPESLYRCRY